MARHLSEVTPEKASSWQWNPWNEEAFLSRFQAKDLSTQKGQESVPFVNHEAEWWARRKRENDEELYGDRSHTYGDGYLDLW